MMKKILLSAVFLAAIGSVAAFGYSIKDNRLQALASTSCQDGATLTSDEVRAANAAGKFYLGNFTSNDTNHTTTVKFTNNADCGAPVTYIDFKVFDTDLSHQEFFDEKKVVVPAHSSMDITINLPVCMAQADIGSGAMPHFLNGIDDTHTTIMFGSQIFNAGGANYINPASGTYCTHDIIQDATLILVKTVSNTHGGTKQVADFALFQNGTQVTSGQAKTYNFASVNDNKILTASETNLAGYTAGVWGGDCAADGKVTIHPGEHKTCTITNSDVPVIISNCADNTTLTLAETRAAITAGKITVSLANDAAGSKTVGIVHNDTGCVLPVSQVTYKMFDQQLATQEMFDYAPVPTKSVLTVAPHTTGTLNTNLPVCMAQTDLFYGPGPLALDNANNYPNSLAYTFYLNTGTGYYNAAGNFCQHVTPSSYLKVIKTVSNTHGGTKQVSDFKLFVNSTQVTSGVDTSFAPGAYSVTEQNLAGYTAGAWGGDCAADGHVTLASGEHKICTITNSDVAVVTTSLKLIKTVSNNYGGTKIATEFPLFVNTTQVTTGQDNTLAPGSYKASEQNLAGYTAGNWGGDCAADGTVVLNAGDHKTCTITNSDNPAVIEKGCLAIHKDAFDYKNTKINPTPAFSFKLDNNLTFTTDSNGNVTIPTISVGFHSITEIVPAGWTLQSITPALANNVVRIGAGSGCAEVTFVNKQIPPTLALTCSASKNPANINDSITYTAAPVGGNSAYTYLWTGDDTLTGSATSTSHIYTTSGTKNAHVVVTSGNQTLAADCVTSITPPTTTNSFALTCSANPSSAFIGNTVTYTANVTGGSYPYTYSWSGTDSLSGSATTTSITYNSVGTKNATVVATSAGQSLTAQCSVPVTTQTIITGCTNCGFLYPPNNPPTVTVTSTPNPGQVAGVFLSQVPYTGIGSNFKIALFMLALFSWSAWISYLIIKRKAQKSGVSVAQMFQSPVAAAPSPAAPFVGNILASVAPVTIKAVAHEQKAASVMPPIESPFLEHMTQKVEEPKAKYEPAMEVSAKKSEPSLMSEIQKPQAQIALPSPHADVVDSLEMHARELQTLVSADGLEIIATASQNNKHNANIILSHLVELYKGSEHETEGDWMVLNGEKISKILFSTYITMTPVFISWLAQGEDKKAMSFVRMLQMQGQTVKDFVMNIVIELDKAYRFRVENVGDADAHILDSTMQWSNNELETVIHTLVTAVDQTYSSVYSSVKIALVKVLDMARTKLYA